MTSPIYQNAETFQKESKTPDELVHKINVFLHEHSNSLTEKYNPKSIIESRFTLPEEAFEKGIVSCGAMANMSAAMLRHIGFKVKLIHGECDSSVDHAWISVQDKESGSWKQYDLTSDNEELRTGHKIKATIDSWEEIRDQIVKDHETIRERRVEKGIPTTIVSVVIPTYNRKDKIIEAINSAIDQKFNNMEIIVVDDGSTDGTTEYLRSLNLNIKLIRKPNGGVSSARNEGIKNAKGKYVAFLDSDDLWLPGKIQAQVDFLESHPDIPLVYTDQYLNIDGKNLNVTRFQRNQPKDRILLSAFVDLVPIHTSTVMVRDSIFNEVGMFDEELSIHEDSELWNRISNKYKLGFIHEVLGVYRWQEGAEHLMSKKNRQKFVDEGKKYLKLYRENKERKLTPEEEKSCEESEKILADIESKLK